MDFLPFPTQEVQVHLSKPTQCHHLSESVSTDLMSWESARPSSPWLSASHAAVTTGTHLWTLLSHSAPSTSHQSPLGASPSASSGTFSPGLPLPLDTGFAQFPSPACLPTSAHPTPTAIHDSCSGQRSFSSNLPSDPNVIVTTFKSGMTQHPSWRLISAPLCSADVVILPCLPATVPPGRPPLAPRESRAQPAESSPDTAGNGRLSSCGTCSCISSLTDPFKYMCLFYPPSFPFSAKCLLTSDTSLNSCLLSALAGCNFQALSSGPRVDLGSRSCSVNVS